MQRVASCGCGSLSVTVKGDPEDCFVCHCDYCQKLTGSIGVFASVFQNNDIISIVGETYKFDDLPEWPGAARFFCSKCGTTVYWVNPTSFPDRTMIAMGCFADPTFPGPSRAMQTQYRHGWCGDFEGAQTFNAYPE